MVRWRAAHLLRGPNTHPVTEAGGAFLLSAAFFLLAGAANPLRHHVLFLVALAGAYVSAVVLLSRRAGPAYAVPLAIAGGVAIDWFYIPPTHEFGSDRWQNWLAILIYISMGVLVGMLAARFRHRAELSEESRDVLLDEQAALRRVATLVAQGVPAPEVFSAIARELGRFLGVGCTHMARYESNGAVTGVGSWSEDGGRHAPVGSQEPLDETSLMGIVFATGRPARMDNYDAVTSERVLELIRAFGIRSSVAAPIVVEGRLWGVMVVSTPNAEPLPPDTESRISAFTELAATAISNTEARTQLGQLVDEQAALRRVATLIARAVPQEEIFSAVTQEVGRLLGTDLAGMIRYDGDQFVTPVAAWAAAGKHPALPERWPVEDGDAATLVANVRQPIRIDNWSAIPGPIAAYVRQIGVGSSVATPILVEGRVWGALAVHAKGSRPLPRDAESRLDNFTDLVATAIANAQARADLGHLADEQAALRRVATLVARGSPPDEVFRAVAEEVAGLLGVAKTMLLRYEDDGTATAVGGSGDGCDAIVGAPEPGTRGTADYPVIVGGRLWGCLVAATEGDEPMPAAVEARMGQFTDLVATSIANVQAHAELEASRARIVAATDEERRRVVRDLHDGAQQRLVHTVVTLKLALRALTSGDERVPELVGEALDHAQTGMVELRELAHGILPAVLNRGGLRAGVEALAARMPVPVDIEVSSERFPAPVEATAYFVVAEALTNVAKHAHADHATVVADVNEGTLRVEIADDGTGSADPNGHGLLGLADRLASLDGRLQVTSVPGDGTKVVATVPVGVQRSSPHPVR